MKKKPPPGATLIARLKEQRLAREAELARRQQAAETAAPTADTTAQADAPGESAAAPQATTPPSTKIHASEPEVPAAAAIEPVQDEATATTATVVAQVETLPPETQHIVITRHSTADLLRREIDIDDLRPTTDDYFVLTDEIRLAGRFAAVGLIAQGLRLSRLKEAQTYKDHYQTFEEYCRKEHQMAATYAYRLMRMAEMAEQVARRGTLAVNSSSQHMPDPFEVLISLGHRHLMALLPLEIETAQELLIKGIPISSDNGDNRVPISRATEKQIRAALKSFSPPPAKTVMRVQKQALVSEKQLIPALSKLVEMLEDWALWLDGDPPAELQAARMGRGQLLNRLAKRFRAASGKIADALDSEQKE